MSEYEEAKARIQPILNELNQCEDSEEEAHGWAHKLDLLLQAADKEIADIKTSHQQTLKVLEANKAELIENYEAELARLREDRDSWRRVAERLEREKQALKSNDS